MVFILWFYGLIILCILIFLVTIIAKFLFSLHFRNYHFSVCSVSHQRSLICTLGFKSPNGLAVFFEGLPLKRTYRSAFMMSSIPPAFVSQSSVFSVAIWTLPNDFSPSPLYFLRLFLIQCLYPPFPQACIFLSILFFFLFFYKQSNFHSDLECMKMLFPCADLGLIRF